MAAWPDGELVTRVDATEGRGTMLSAPRLTGRVVPVLGVNDGNLGSLGSLGSLG